MAALMCMFPLQLMMYTSFNLSCIRFPSIPVSTWFELGDISLKNIFPVIALDKQPAGPSTVTVYWLVFLHSTAASHGAVTVVAVDAYKVLACTHPHPSATMCKCNDQFQISCELWGMPTVIKAIPKQENLSFCSFSIFPQLYWVMFPLTSLSFSVSLWQKQLKKRG